LVCHLIALQAFQSICFHDDWSKSNEENKEISEELAVGHSRLATGRRHQCDFPASPLGGTAISYADRSGMDTGFLHYEYILISR
jgi:hypothetical protein